MTITLYSFDKRENSTKQPQAGLDFDNVVLKEPTDFLSPVIRFTSAGLGGPTIAPISYNYARIPKFQRYYFIRDWEYVGGCWEASLSVDVLGTWKGTIGATTCYVERSESAYDGSIIDNMFPANTNYNVVNNNLASAWYGVAPSGGSYILGVINNINVGRVGAVSYYALSQAQLTTFIDYIFSNNIFTSSSITEIGQGLFKSLFNPFQYVVSCMWLPFSTETFGNSTHDISLGYWSTGVSGTIVSSLAQQTYVTGSFPDHPQLSRGSFLNYSPYAYYTLYVPPFGAIPIDSSFRRAGQYIRCAVYIDHITGQATMRAGVSNTQGGVITIWGNEVSCMFGVPIQLSQVMSDYSSMISGAGGGGGGLLSSLLSGAVSSAVNAFSPQVKNSGANGSFLNNIAPPALISSFALITPASDNILGRPLLANRAINTLSGYVKCRNPRISAPCLLEEKGKIEAYMTEGFYYE